MILQHGIESRTSRVSKSLKNHDTCAKNMRPCRGKKKYERRMESLARTDLIRSQFLQLVQQNINIFVFEDHESIVATAYSEHTTPETLRTIWFGAQRAPKPANRSRQEPGPLYTAS